MKRLLLCAALLAAPLAHAQWVDDDPRRAGGDIGALHDELDRLRNDEFVLRYAAEEFARAENFIEDLAEDAPYRVHEADLAKAERLLQRVERVAMKRSGRHDDDVVVIDDGRRERDVVVIENDDGRAWDEARDARSEAERARAAADEERERALAARLEAEHAQNENARLRAELGEAQTRVTDRGLVLTLGDVLFAVGKADLKPGATRTLDKLVAAMKRDPDTTVTIEGHTDSTGRREFNQTLSNRRANAVRSYLASKGVPAARIQARGLGPDFPVATNATESGRQQNRRVEVLVQNEDVGD